MIASLESAALAVGSLAAYALIGRLTHVGEARSSQLTGTAARMPRAAAVVTSALVLLTMAGRGAGEPLRGVFLVCVGLGTWKLVTLDLDVTVDARPQWTARAGLVALACATALWTPVGLLWLALATSAFPLWQHHLALTVRLVKLCIALNVAALVLDRTLMSVDGRVLRQVAVVLCAALAASHYLIPGLGKLRLGPRWSSWMRANRIEYLAGNAREWGWRLPISNQRFTRLLGTIASHRTLINTATVLIELSAVGVLSSRCSAFVVLGALLVLHVAIATLSGIAFWENAVCLAAIATLVVAPAEGAVFGVDGVVATVLVIGIAVATGTWRPAELAWWDSPLCGRILIVVHGTDGGAYTVYNDYLCPLEREYGRQYGLFHLSDPVIYGHLGIVRSLSLVDALEASKGDPRALASIAGVAGRRHGDPHLAAGHLDALQALFTATNSGVRKHVLPRSLRWLKAPGGQLFYSGHGAPYHGQARVAAIEVWFFERYLDRRSLEYHTVRHEQLARAELIGEVRGSDR